MPDASQVPMALEGIRVLELQSTAPGPYCAMLLGDLGAEVLQVDRPAQVVADAIGPSARDQRAEEQSRAHNALARNKRSIALDLKQPEAVEIFLRLAEDADVVIEGFRPGVVDRLGVGYSQLSKLNPRLVYCSLSGYGQDGPYRDLVGHDINYISIGGALSTVGRPGQGLSIPQNTIGDFAGGGLMAAFSVLAALMARERSGRGQHVDAAMSDGVLYLQSFLVSNMLGGRPAMGDDDGVPRAGRGSLGGEWPSYDVYETLDGQHMSIGAVEPKFWATLCEEIGHPELAPLQHDSTRHAEIRAKLSAIFRQHTREEWFERLKPLEVCAAPVLSLQEALDDPHHRARGMSIELEDRRIGPVRQVGIGPKLSETPGRVRFTAPAPGEHTDEVLEALGYEVNVIAALRERGVVE